MKASGDVESSQPHAAEPPGPHLFLDDPGVGDAELHRDRWVLTLEPADDAGQQVDPGRGARADEERASSFSSLVMPSVRRPSLRAAWTTQLWIARADGSNFRASSSGVWPEPPTRRGGAATRVVRGSGPWHRGRLPPSGDRCPRNWGKSRPLPNAVLLWRHCDTNPDNLTI
jgi:hypothetical protein